MKRFWFLKEEERQTAEKIVRYLSSPDSETQHAFGISYLQMVFHLRYANAVKILRAMQVEQLVEEGDFGTAQQVGRFGETYSCELKYRLKKKVYEQPAHDTDGTGSKRHTTLKLSEEEAELLPKVLFDLEHSDGLFSAVYLQFAYNLPYKSAVRLVLVLVAHCEVKKGDYGIMHMPLPLGEMCVCRFHYRFIGRGELKQ